MRKPGKMNIGKFIMYLLIGSFIGGIVMGIVGYLVAVPRDGDAVISMWIGVVFGAIFSGPLLASNLVKEK